jgi:hypothetical protein
MRMNVMTVKHGLKRFSEFRTLVKNALDRSRVPRDPSVLKLQSDMSGCRVMNGDDFTVISNCINDSQGSKDKPLTIDCDLPWTDEIHGNLVPRGDLRISGRHFALAFAR